MRTNTKAYQNKIDMGYNKYMHKTEQHAFVRVTMSLANSTYSETKSSIIDFTKAFYPQFIDFITEESIAK